MQIFEEHLRDAYPAVMPDFVGTYQLAGDPPEKWLAELSSVADSLGLELPSASPVRNRRLTIKIRVPKSAPDPAIEIAGSFFADAARVLSGGRTGSGQAQLISIAPASSSIELLLSPLRRFGYVAWPGLALGLGYASIHVLDRLPPVSLGTVIALTACIFVFFGIVAVFGSNVRREFATNFEKNRQAVQERALVQQVAGEEDPKMQARLELARIRLRSRASNMRGDADRLWKRSLWTYRGALFFFCLAIAGPGVAATLLLHSPNPDWHFMFGGLSLAAVPLGIGTALLRHDTKLREQYQEAARDVASLERYELALDYAQIASQKTYQATMQQVIVQLLSSRTGLPVQSPLSPAAGEKGEDVESTSGIQKILDATVEKTGEVVAAIVPKKSG